MNSVGRALVTEPLELVRISKLVKAAHSDTTQKRILCIRASKCHALPEHFLSTPIWSQYTIGVLSELRMHYW
jgi:hypothetical protein